MTTTWTPTVMPSEIGPVPSPSASRSSVVGDCTVNLQRAPFPKATVRIGIPTTIPGAVPQAI